MFVLIGHALVTEVYVNAPDNPSPKPSPPTYRCCDN